MFTDKSMGPLRSFFKFLIRKREDHKIVGLYDA